jgi:type I restriction enzyme, S subunit
MAVEGWEDSTFGDLLDIEGGTQPPKDTFVYEPQDGYIRLLQIRDFESDEKPAYIKESHRFKKCNKDDVLIARYGASLGRICTGKSGAYNVALTKVVKKNNKIHQKFLYYWLNSSIFQDHLIKVGGRSAQAGFNKEDLAPLKMLCPPLSEQKKIAEILEGVDDAIAKTESVIAQTQRVKQGLLQQLLTRGIGHTKFKQTPLGEIPESWEVLKIEDVLDQLIDYRGVPPPKSDCGVPLITAKNVRFGYLNPEPREYISNEDYDAWMRRGFPNVGDVLFTTEAPLGNVAQIPNYKIALGQRTLTLSPNPKILTQDFLKWRLMSPATQSLIHEHGTGSTAKGIKQSTFRKLQIAIPPLSEQSIICAALNSVENTLTETSNKLEAIRRIKSSLMSDLLTGRVRVNVDAKTLNKIEAAA